MARSPFRGDVVPSRVRLLARTPTGRPFPHLGNYREPLRILDAIFWGTEGLEGSARHNRYLTGPLLPLGFVTREPAVIKAILLATGDKPGQFDRDTWPTSGIARATGANTLLYANGPRWRGQKRMVASSFAASALFQAEVFAGFEATFRRTVGERLDAFGARHGSVHPDGVEIELEAEISAVMLEMLLNNFFGAQVAYDVLRQRHVPALNELIRRMVRDTLGFRFLMGGRRRHRELQAAFEVLVDHALEGRAAKKGGWARLDTDLPDEALRPNLRVFLAGALEATTSLAAWTMVHLARRPDLQRRIHDEVKGLDSYDPDNLAQCPTLDACIQETLRLTPALYFLPRVATADTWVTLEDGRRLMLPTGTHVILDVWHANRCEEFWGVAASGYPADAFEPDRWHRLEQAGKGPQQMLHFGFGHGPRVCPGKFLGLLEVGLVVGGLVKVFHAWTDAPTPAAAAGVSTKPADGARVRLKRRDAVPHAAPPGPSGPK